MLSDIQKTLHNTNHLLKAFSSFLQELGPALKKMHRDPSAGATGNSMTQDQLHEMLLKPCKESWRNHMCELFATLIELPGNTSAVWAKGPAGRDENSKLLDCIAGFMSSNKLSGDTHLDAYLSKLARVRWANKKQVLRNHMLDLVVGYPEITKQVADTTHTHTFVHTHICTHTTRRKI